MRDMRAGRPSAGDEGFVVIGVGSGADQSGDRIGAVLRSELVALDRLIYTLEMQRLVLDAGRTDLLAESGRDVEAALERLRRADLVRAVTVSTLHAHLVCELQAMGVAANGYPSLGQIAAAVRDADAHILRELARALKRSLAKAMGMSEENRRRLAGARAQVASDELAVFAGAIAVDDFLTTIDRPQNPDVLLHDIEGVIFDDEDPLLADALNDLQMQAVTFDAALGVLQSVGCRPLLEFLADTSAE